MDKSEHFCFKILTITQQKGEDYLLDYPQKPIALTKFEVLRRYMTLETEHHYTYERLKRGYEGEKMFATLLERELSQPFHALYDLQFKENGSEVQIDCLLFIGQKIFLFEVKHYYGNYLINNNRWFLASTNKEIKSPLHQIQRSTLLLKDFFSHYHITEPIISKLVFTHPEFYLYQAPYNSSMIFPNQLNQLIKSLQIEQVHPLKQDFLNIINTLKNSHLTTLVHEQVPAIQYNQLKKGVFCKTCSKKMKNLNQKKFYCAHCKQSELKKNVVLKRIADYQILFPHEILTADRLFEWIGKTTTKRTVQRILTNI